MTRIKCTDDASISLADILRRIQRLEYLAGIGSATEAASGTTDASRLSKGGQEARAMRDRVQSINRENSKFWAKESA